MNTLLKSVGLLGASVLAAGLLGCGSESGPDSQEPTVIDPTFEDGQGQKAAPTQRTYAPGPYGFEVGRIVPDMQWIGYANFEGNKDNPDMQGLQVMNLADFYNPTDDEVFPEGSPYGAGTPKPKALVLVMGSVWCPPCQQEAEVSIPYHLGEYRDQGGLFVSILIDSGTPGEPATVQDLTNWADNYDVDYPRAIDPSEQVTTLYEPAFPGNMIVDTTDMSIVRVVSGSPSNGDQFWTTFESVINGTNI